MFIDYDSLSNIERHRLSEELKNNIELKISYEKALRVFHSCITDNEELGKAYENFKANQNSSLFPEEDTLIYTGLDKIGGQLHFFIYKSQNDLLSLRIFDIFKNAFINIDIDQRGRRYRSRLKIETTLEWDLDKSYFKRIKLSSCKFRFKQISDNKKLTLQEKWNSVHLDYYIDHSFSARIGQVIKLFKPYTPEVNYFCTIYGNLCPINYCCFGSGILSSNKEKYLSLPNVGLDFHQSPNYWGLMPEDIEYLPISNIKNSNSRQKRAQTDTLT